MNPAVILILPWAALIVAGARQVVFPGGRSSSPVSPCGHSTVAGSPTTRELLSPSHAPAGEVFCSARREATHATA